MAISTHDERLYRASFLTAEDVAGLEAREAVHREEAEPGDDAWTPCDGINAGFQVWQRLQGTDLTRVVDVRWLFPSDTLARRYHRSRIEANSEGLRAIPQWTLPGHDVAAFSGRIHSEARSRASTSSSWAESAPRSSLPASKPRRLRRF